MERQENVLVIGNGFDLYHFLPTRYIDFMKVIDRLLILEGEGRLEKCQYIKYLWGPDSPIYQGDKYIRECYEIHKLKMQSVELNREKIKELVAICKTNIWIKYFRMCAQKDIGWIDFEKEIGIVLTAIQNLFGYDSSANAMVNGISYSELTDIDLKTIDILEQLPFINASDFYFSIKKEYCEKAMVSKLYVSINRKKILDELEENLEQLAQALCIYLKEFVQRIAISKSSDNPIFYNINKVLNFNYTDTYTKLYDKNVEVKYIHGSINNDETGIVLGINNDSMDELEKMDASLIRFKKYYQRAIKDTFYSVEDFLREDKVCYNVSIVGHSIEITDRDILVGLLNHPKTNVTIYYHDDIAHGQQVVNLISLVGKKRFDELRNEKKVRFSKLKEYKERVTNESEEIYEDYSLIPEFVWDEDIGFDMYSEKKLRNYRILESTYGTSNTLLIGSEIVKVGVRDDVVGNTEIEQVDHFLDVVNYYNHSRIYKGVVKLEALFHDNRYNGVGVTIIYYKGDNETEEDIASIPALLETEYNFEAITVCEMKVIDHFG